MNNVVLQGRNVRDVEVKYTPSQMAVARFTLAVDRGGRGKEADFINCVAFGKTAELMDRFTAKGLRVVVQGRIQTGSYEKNGQKVYTTDIIADRVDFIDWKEGNKAPAEENPYDSFQALNEDCPF